MGKLIALAAATTVTALIAVATLASAADEKPWWDMANCDFCLNMSSQPGLLQAMQWENHKLQSGSISIVRTDPKHIEPLRQAMVAMNETGAKAMAGAELTTCGMCTAMGEVMMAGASMEMVETPNGHISIMTSTNPEIVAKLHAIVDKNEAEMTKMMGGEKHHGHDHGHSHGHTHGG